MSAARLAAGAAAICACALFGAVRNSEATARLRAAEGIRSDLREAMHMLSSRRELPLICGTLSERGACASFWRGMRESLEEGLSFPEAYQNAEKPRMGREAEEALAELCKLLGTGGAEAEAERVEEALKKLDGIIGTMQKERAEKGKLTSSLSLLLGLCLALLLI